MRFGNLGCTYKPPLLLPPPFPPPPFPPPPFPPPPFPPPPFPPPPIPKNTRPAARLLASHPIPTTSTPPAAISVINTPEAPERYLSSASSVNSSACTVDSLERRVKQLETELQSALTSRNQADSPLPLRQRQSSPLRVPADSSEISKTNFVSLPIRGTMSKTRFFGQSHGPMASACCPPSTRSSSASWTVPLRPAEFCCCPRWPLARVSPPVLLQTVSSMVTFGPWRLSTVFFTPLPSKPNTTVTGTSLTRLASLSLC
ncbi:hypothetical protein B0T26DRAFT_782372 [Lasiosphaeria miniovina]|uniref:Uncharacterized protein n=1 Tax=Lasiosphaeria miniovina TaxID=1954250 RepID=A0AA40DU44_9PEZI|nr:uncharacterized protein B0T26DRAFT_782372 [Lasiosphaeria miniovina]KAK0713452.1 hypothetical protein B0T26DRAFT_782372 [Lasiosphaeria miniovina]